MRETKKCSTCEQCRPLSAFHTTTRGPETRCRACVAEYLRTWRKSRKTTTTGTRTCRVCTKRKPLQAFPVELSSVKGRSWRCSACVADYQQRWTLEKRKNKPVFKRARSPGGPYIVKQCDVCGNDYMPGSPLQHRCKPCQRYLRTRTSDLDLSDRDRRIVILALRVAKTCQYCGDVLNGSIIEHMDPCAGDCPSNLTISCRACNMGKGASTASDYIARCVRVAKHAKRYAVKTIEELAIL
jgi:hypothetical protein